VAQGLTERLLAHDVEVAFIAEPVHFETLRTRAVFEEELVLVAPRSFPEPDDVDAISGRTVVAFESGCAYRRYLEEWLLESGIVPGGIMAVGSYLAILVCVAAGTGFAVVPRSVLDTVATRGEFRTCRLPAKLRRIRTMMAWRRGERSAKLDGLQALLPAI
jgi:DNA-binding transcriptional LysR family regulator